MNRLLSIQQIKKSIRNQKQKLQLQRLNWESRELMLPRFLHHPRLIMLLIFLTCSPWETPAKTNPSPPLPMKMRGWYSSVCFPHWQFHLLLVNSGNLIALLLTYYSLELPRRAAPETTSTSGESESVNSKSVEIKNQSNCGFEELFKDLQWVTPPASDKPAKGAKNDVMNLFEKVYTMTLLNGISRNVEPLDRRPVCWNRIYYADQDIMN
ncbi:hypothetical protein CsSME_00032121 [Camellia sinensis var. sinensis]